MNNELDIFDSEAAIKQAGGDAELADELFGMLVNELPTYKEKIALQCKENDYTNLLETTHKLNGATRYTGVPALGAAANQLEQAIRGDIITNYDELCNHLMDEIQRLKDAYPKK
ncbi:MAG: Hpt domain-containing protein [Chromatiales bacterium]|nr:Hpt domain-containing protein [Chromatiales bacterium]